MLPPRRLNNRFTLNHIKGVMYEKFTTMNENEIYFEFYLMCGYMIQTEIGNK